MATATMDKAFAGRPKADLAKSTTSFFGAIFNRLIAAREIEARRRVASHLNAYSDAQLAQLGMGARDIELVRHGSSFNIELCG